MGFSYQGERLKTELEKLTAGRAGTWIQQADATSEADLEALFATVKEQFGGAGLSGTRHRLRAESRDGRPFHRHRAEDWNTALSVSAYTSCRRPATPTRCCVKVAAS